MKYIMAILALSLALTACGERRTTCYGVEPDGEVETLMPCPNGWKDKETRIIKEDEFKHLEVEKPSKPKKKGM